jgi:hypothetical protein
VRAISAADEWKLWWSTSFKNNGFVTHRGPGSPANRRKNGGCLEMASYDYRAQHANSSFLVLRWGRCRRLDLGMSSAGHSYRLQPGARRLSAGQ